jgi:uncharacterized protein YgbK (DUF1537 family)
MKRLSAISSDILIKYPSPDLTAIEAALQKELLHFDRKIIVLDDDPTGTQTVHGISVFTDWSAESIKEGFLEKNKMFYLLTNSRGMTVVQTEQIHKDIVDMIEQISKELHISYSLISRSDSTLRGHYPLETETLRKEIEKRGRSIDGEILAPFFLAGGRFTLNNIHYVQEGDQLTPAGHTEFAKDKSFGYKSSHMGEWCEEKTQGAFKEEDVTYISLDEIRSCDYKSIYDKLMKVRGFNKVVVNAIADSDMKVFVTALLRTLKDGKDFMFRTAAGFPQVIGGITDKPLLVKEELVTPGNSNGGIVLIGSHVNKTTQQMDRLLKSDLPINGIEFNQHRVLEEGGLDKEVARVLTMTEKMIHKGENVVIYTRRDRFDLDTDNKDEQLAVSVKISDALTSIIGKLNVRPNFIIAKGGITSSDVGTKALKVKKALVLGQILPGVPVWKTGPESKFPDLPYVIFPGNVGSEDALRDAVSTLCL